MGAGVDLITACDIRYCSAGARFCVKEVDIAIVADMGTLQRLPGIVGQGPHIPTQLPASTSTLVGLTEPTPVSSLTWYRSVAAN